MSSHTAQRSLEALRQIGTRSVSRLSLTALVLLTLASTVPALAQTPQSSPPVAAPAMQPGSARRKRTKRTPVAEPPIAQQPPLSSTEEGQTPMDESFSAVDDAQYVQETRRKAFEDTKFNVQPRSYYLDRDKFDGSESEAWALGGSAGFKTGYFRERFALGATGYTSQRLNGDRGQGRHRAAQARPAQLHGARRVVWRVPARRGHPAHAPGAAASTRPTSIATTAA